MSPTVYHLRNFSRAAVIMAPAPLLAVIGVGVRRRAVRGCRRGLGWQCRGDRCQNSRLDSGDRGACWPNSRLKSRVGREGSGGVPIFRALRARTSGPRNRDTGGRLIRLRPAKGRSGPSCGSNTDDGRPWRLGPTGRCPSESTVSAGHWCSRWTRAATGFADRKNTHVDFSRQCKATVIRKFLSPGEIYHVRGQDRVVLAPDCPAALGVAARLGPIRLDLRNLCDTCGV